MMPQGIRWSSLVHKTCFGRLVQRDGEYLHGRSNKALPPQKRLVLGASSKAPALDYIIVRRCPAVESSIYERGYLYRAAPLTAACIYSYGRSGTTRFSGSVICFSFFSPLPEVIECWWAACMCALLLLLEDDASIDVTRGNPHSLVRTSKSHAIRLVVSVVGVCYITSSTCMTNM